jgi:hypothetical protein
MAKKFWYKDGKIMLDQYGKVILSETSPCCCEPVVPNSCPCEIGWPYDETQFPCGPDNLQYSYEVNWDGVIAFHENANCEGPVLFELQRRPLVAGPTVVTASGPCQWSSGWFDMEYRTLDRDPEHYVETTEWATVSGVITTNLLTGHATLPNAWRTQISFGTGFAAISYKQAGRTPVGAYVAGGATLDPCTVAPSNNRYTNLSTIEVTDVP